MPVLADAARRSIVLDVGATIGADAAHLFDMRSWDRPWRASSSTSTVRRVGLLNVGTEEDIKGLEEVKAASRRLRKPTCQPRLSRLRRGDDLGRQRSTSLVTEGFTGNIALKTGGGHGKADRNTCATRSLSSLRPGSARPAGQRALPALKERSIPRGQWRAVSRDGVIIKSHGGMDASAIASAIEIGYDHGPPHRLLDKNCENHQPVERGRDAAAPLRRNGIRRRP